MIMFFSMNEQAFKTTKILLNCEENEGRKSTFSRHHEDLMIRGIKKVRNIRRKKAK